MADKIYTLLPQKCTGCRTCQVACAAAKRENGAPMGRARIQIVDKDGDRHVQLNCLQCINAACMAVCPTGALCRDEESRAVILRAEQCIGCGACAAACPFGHIYFDDKKHLPLKCDLCGGDPECVKYCPHQALVMR